MPDALVVSEIATRATTGLAFVSRDLAVLAQHHKGYHRIPASPPVLTNSCAEFVPLKAGPLVGRLDLPDPWRAVGAAAVVAQEDPGQDLSRSS